ncbi:unnamed protein product [Acanthoscelides obtectus]|uniref:HTH psq-type domain-containing protein n=1 Tax=Acanthoscelides obtectus TaxID=200917 RepID=A0A9P0PH55_ACAOB|nr:unnamed protein product [Acanthoscelides obtectus]CAK1670219.1 hypothetical protein AOBTE_LOCUS27486 [Acanthoscelides obtectus]
MRTYKRRTERADTPKDVLETACHPIIFDTKCINATSRQYDIPFKTLHRYVAKLKAKLERNPNLTRAELTLDSVGYIKDRQVVTDEEEESLASYLKKAADIYYGLTPYETRKLASCDLSTVSVPSTSNASNTLSIVQEVPIALTPQYLSVNTDQITTTTPSPKRSLRTECDSPSVFEETFNSVFEPELREKLKAPENVHYTEANVPPSLHNLNLSTTSSATFEELRPFPKAAPLLENRRNIRKRKSTIYTDTQEKLNLLDMKNERETYKKKKTDTKDRIGKGKGKGKRKGKGTDKADEIADDTAAENDGSAVDSDDESTICLECTESYVDSVPGEQWIQCLT